MRKFKHIVPFILAVCLVFSLCFSLACSTSKELVSISLDASNAKVDFSLGEEYRPSGLVVTANYKSGQSEAIGTENVTIDSSAYDAYTVGTYDIKVSYSSEGTTAEASYKVNVVETLSGGLVVTIKSGRPSRFDLSATEKTADLSNASSWIEVRKPNANGDVDMSSKALSRDSYTVEIYKGADKVTNLSAVNRGNYQIWASLYDDKEDYTYSGFVNILVFDDVSSIVFKEGKTNQDKSLRETMTPTWKFTVTYNSGDTEVVDRTNKYLSISSINPNIVGNSGTATVKYQEPNTREQTTSVNYTLGGTQMHPQLSALSFGDMEKGKLDETYYVDTKNVQFEIVKGGEIAERGANVQLPTGIVDENGSETVTVGMAWQSGGASSAKNGRYINFSADKEFEIYIYAEANGENDRCMFLETESDYALINLIEGYVGDKPIQAINGVPTAYKNTGYSVHAVSVTGISEENPADFSLSFDASLYVYYVLIVFPEEA